MADVRLIDANALKRQAVEVEIVTPPHNHYCSELVVFGYDIDEQSTIDAVPVVRCRECKHWSGRKDKPGEVTAIGYCGHPNHHIMPLNANWFCADGAKMDGGADNV